MRRREFIRKSAVAIGGVLYGPALPGWGAEQVERSGMSSETHVMTVLGAVAPDALVVTLPHEHVMVDFIGAEKAGRDRYDADEVFETALPHLQQVRKLGCRTLVECTPAYIGRDAALLRRLS